jgi:hypothetical protein
LPAWRPYRTVSPEGSNLTYTVKLIKGEMPAAGTDVAVFIDIIGRPLTS